jgi:tRNA modification GTPase
MPCADTIAALSSATGSSCAAIVRISGPEALRIAGSLCQGGVAKRVAGFRAEGAFIEIPGAGRVSCDVYVFRAPNSYTTEDVAEIHLPGSPLLVEKLLLELAARGARPAQPGEFTRRAYVGGRVDLAEAEAVSSVINAGSQAELAAATQVLAGALSELIGTISTRMKDALALVEAGIDFSDQDTGAGCPEEVSRLLQESAALLETGAGKQATATRDMLRIVICGAANVGKSTLFNRLVGRERVLTSPQPGTTRDVVSAETELGGTKLLLLDSAGHRTPDGEVETLALSAMEESVSTADLAVFVMEAHHPPSEREMEFCNGIECRRILVANKSDLGISTSIPECLRISCVTGEGLSALRAELARLVCTGTGRYPGALALSVRQRDALSRAREGLECALEQSEEELLAADLREAIGALGEITGGALGEELLDRIFSQFCIGK